LLKWDCINAGQRNRAKRGLVVAQLVPSHVPNQARTGATAAALVASGRRDPAETDSLAEGEGFELLVPFVSPMR